MRARTNHRPTAVLKQGVLMLAAQGRRVLIFTLLLCASAAAAQPIESAEKAGTLNVAFADRTVTVRGATPGAQVVIFGIGIGADGFNALLTRDVRAATDDDRDGSVAFEVRHVPTWSVWVAVDIDTGAHAVATPDGTTPRSLNIDPEEWRGNRAHIDAPRTYMEFLVVRPRVGAWSRRLADGGSRDADQVANGISRLRLDTMEIVTGTEKGPPFPLPRDLVVAIDPQTLDLFVSEAR